MREIKESCFILKENPVDKSISNQLNLYNHSLYSKDNLIENNSVEAKEFKLPDGQIISLEPEKHIIEKMFSTVK